MYHRIHQINRPALLFILLALFHRIGRSVSFTRDSGKSTLVVMSLTSSAETVSHEQRLQSYLSEQNIQLPPAPKPAANYCPCQRSDNLLYLSGHLPFRTDGTGLSHTGRLSASLLDDPVSTGYDAARQVGLNIIATLRKELGGSIDDVDQVVKLFGFVQSMDDFHEQHLVLNGCSDLMVHIFGPRGGVHARSAIGTNALPLNSMVEIEAIVRIKSRALE
jgi:enamine deaminase RidA (YjgF/YER057c/UK114 family)